MVNVLASSAVERGFEPRSGQTKDYKIRICCFFAEHAPLKRKSKDWLTRNQDNVSEWGGMSIRGLLFQWASIIKKNRPKRVDLVQSWPYHNLIENCRPICYHKFREYIYVNEWVINECSFLLNAIYKWWFQWNMNLLKHESVVKLYVNDDSN
jgi:hypothetical protein